MKISKLERFWFLSCSKDQKMLEKVL